jgi:hypothetical protein
MPSYVDTSVTTAYYIKSVSDSKYLSIENGALVLTTLGHGWTIGTGSVGDANTIKDPGSGKYLIHDGTSVKLDTGTANSDWKGLIVNSTGDKYVVITSELNYFQVPKANY